MEKNYIRQLLLVLEDYLFSLKWYDKEGNEMMLKNIIGFDSIFQIIPKRFHKLLEGRIYTQQELSKAREEGENEPEKVYVDPIVPNFTEELSAPVEYRTREEIKERFKDTPEEFTEEVVV